MCGCTRAIECVCLSESMCLYIYIWFFVYFSVLLFKSLNPTLSFFVPIPSWASLAGSPTPAPPRLCPTLQPPAAAPPSHVVVAVHAQRLDLSGLLLLVLSTDRPEQVPRPGIPSRGGRGSGSRRREPRLHSPTGRHHHAKIRPRLPAFASLSWPHPFLRHFRQLCPHPPASAPS